jgi:hypothetical protein
MRPLPPWGQGWRKGGYHHHEKRISQSTSLLFPAGIIVFALITSIIQEIKKGLEFFPAVECDNGPDNTQSQDSNDTACRTLRGIRGQRGWQNGRLLCRDPR